MMQSIRDIVESILTYIHGRNSIIPIRIAVFCAATNGTSPVHLAAARALAQVLHEHSIHLVYGGGTTGLMGELARTLVSLSGPGSVTGIIPRDMLALERPGQTASKSWFHGFGIGNKEKEKSYDAIYCPIILVKDLAVRKKLIVELVRDGGPSGFVGLSGGYGTLDEVFEVVALRQQRKHDRGIVLLNVDGYWDDIMGWLERAIESGFVKAERRNMLVSRDDAEGVVSWLSSHR